MTRYELIAHEREPLDLGVFLVTVDSPEDRAALAHFRRRRWRVRHLRTRATETRRLARDFNLSASNLRRALELQTLRELNAAASTPRPHTMRASGLRKHRPEPDL